MASVSDLVDLPKQVAAWEEGKGFRGSYGIDAERAFAKDLRTLLALCVQQAGAMEEAQERIARLSEQLPSSAVDTVEDGLGLDTADSDDSPLEEAARTDRRARRQAKLAREALRERVVEAYGQGVSICTLSEVTGLGRQSIYSVLGKWKRKPRKSASAAASADAAGETRVTLI